MMIRECAKGDVKFFGRKCIILRNGDLKEYIMYTEESNYWERRVFFVFFLKLNKMKVGLHSWLSLK